MIKIILPGVAALLALFAFLVFSGKIPIGSNSSKAQGPTGDLEIWGTLPSEAVNPILQDLTNSVKTYTVAYTEIPEADFNDQLTNMLASGRGPDLILAPYQIILAQKDRILSFPYASLPANSYRNAYVDGAAVFLVNDGALALPVSIEPMVLFFNRTLFAKHGIAGTPMTWNDVLDMVPYLTVRDDATGKFLESGIALGATTNIKYAKDILMTLVAELNQRPVTFESTNYQVTADTPTPDNPDVHPLTSALQLFTQFSKPRSAVFSWNALQDDSLDRFVSGSLAMYLGYSGEAPLIAKKNGRLDVGIAMFPQAKGYNTHVTSMKLYGLATLKRTTFPTTSLTAQAALAGADYGPAIASAVGGITPLKSILSQDQGLDPSIKTGALVATGWFDTASDISSQYIARMVDDVVTERQEVSDATNDFVNNLQSVYK